MTEHLASRTLLKSPPELWSECSDAQSLARHLGEFAGEIRITRVEPETTVAWEGERASGTVRLEPSGWGTKVTLTARTKEQTQCPDEPVGATQDDPVVTLDEQPATVEHQPPAATEPEPRAPLTPQEPEAARRGLLARVRRWFAPEVPATDAVAEEAPLSDATPPGPKAPEADPTPPTKEPDTGPPAQVPTPDVPSSSGPSAAAVALISALDSLGKAHHRPFSRA